MDYFEISWAIDPPSPGSEILIAELSEIGYESFEETAAGLKSFIPAKLFNEQEIEEIVRRFEDSFSLSFVAELIREQNWNKVWETAYSPVVIRDEIYVFAPFHEQKSHYRYQLEIEPRMSFGTAHHETTSLMMEWMLGEDFSGTTVLDMGCGTGILAILSEMMGAREIIAIDNDTNAVGNARDNVKKNKCKNVSVHLADSILMDKKFDVILANINKNILLKNIPEYALHLKTGGILFLSGFYNDDLPAIESLALNHDISFTGKLEKNGWIAARFVKSQ